ncbi:GTP 3',8-cyclase MoaA [Uliginosibacterium sp. sgz301328]|uniref:GTP 3',8-cyclase MoaA n=1 Tax=Uliginosibacterium sp. sgz301328 TaxID=3243764 RepID=UPI00359E7F73
MSRVLVCAPGQQASIRPARIARDGTVHARQSPVVRVQRSCPAENGRHVSQCWRHDLRISGDTNVPGGWAPLASAPWYCAYTKMIDTTQTTSTHVTQRQPDPKDGGGALVDREMRRMRDLRISVTDRCNFRCSYCMPKNEFSRKHVFLPRTDLLSFSEIVRIARLFVAEGVSKIRITGGEPLLRRDIECLIAELAALGTEVTLTTNGSLLADKARVLADAGLRRVTVSLDALDDSIFRRMNNVGFPVGQVLAGVEAAAAAGLAPVKLNCVVRRGVNDDQILPLARHFRGTGHILRFIEFMDVGMSNGWKMDEVLPSAQVLARLQAEFPLDPVDQNYPGEVAARWQYRDGTGEIGLISSVTQAFCRDCTRARLSPDGRLFTCLFANHGHDLRGPMRAGVGDAQLARMIRTIWNARGDRYSEIRGTPTAGSQRIEMSYIGG